MGNKLSQSLKNHLRTIFLYPLKPESSTLDPKTYSYLYTYIYIYVYTYALYVRTYNACAYIYIYDIYHTHRYIYIYICSKYTRMHVCMCIYLYIHIFLDVAAWAPVTRCSRGSSKLRSAKAGIHSSAKRVTWGFPTVRNTFTGDMWVI